MKGETEIDRQGVWWDKTHEQSLDVGQEKRGKPYVGESHLVLRLPQGVRGRASPAPVRKLRRGSAR